MPGEKRLGGYSQSAFSASVPRGNNVFIDHIRYNSGNQNYQGWGANSASRSQLEYNNVAYGYLGANGGNFQIDERNDPAIKKVRSGVMS